MTLNLAYPAPCNPFPNAEKFNQYVGELRSPLPPKAQTSLRARGNRFQNQQDGYAHEKSKRDKAKF